MGGGQIGDDEELLRFLNPLGNHVVMEPDGIWRITSAAFRDPKALKDPRAGISVFLESGSNLQRLESFFRGERNHGLARLRTKTVRAHGFLLVIDPSDEFPDDFHVLIRPAPTWSRGEYNVGAAALAAHATIDYLPIVE